MSKTEGEGERLYALMMVEEALGKLLHIGTCRLRLDNEDRDRVYRASIDLMDILAKERGEPPHKRPKRPVPDESGSRS